MKPDTKMKSDELGLLSFLVVLELFIVPLLPLGKYGGGIAMIAVAVVGLPAYWVMFGERLRSRGELKLAVVIVTVSVLVGGVVAALQPLWR
jgi:hypothetical protein